MAGPLVVELFANGLCLFDRLRARLPHFFILCRALCPAYAYGGNDLLAVLDRNTALQWREVRRQRRHGEAALVDDILEIAGGFLEQRGGLRLADGNVRAGGERAVKPDEVEQM